MDTTVDRDVVEDAHGWAVAVYRVTRELFLASSNELVTQLAYADDPERVVIDLSGSHVWDASTVAVLDAVTTEYAQRDQHVEIAGLDAAGGERHARLTGHLTGHLAGHQRRRRFASRRGRAARAAVVYLDRC